MRYDFTWIKGSEKRNHTLKTEMGKYMYTVSDIIADIDRGCTANNMAEDRFSYRIVFFVNEGARSSKHYLYAYYANLRQTLENIIKGYLSLTNCIVIAETTALKNGRCVRLQSRTYAFSLDGYFKQITGYFSRPGQENLLT